MSRSAGSRELQIVLDAEYIADYDALPISAILKVVLEFQDGGLNNCSAKCAIISEPMNRILGRATSQDDGMDLNPVAVPVDGDARGL